MRRSTTQFVLILLCILSSTMFGRTFVITTGGNDGNAGTLAAPWRTLAKANDALRAGDTVLVRSGIYHERIVPSESGVAGSPIVYRAYPGEQVIIDGADDTQMNLVALYTSWVVIEGFTFNNQDYFDLPNNNDYWIDIAGSHNTFRYNRVIAPGDVYNNIYARNATSRGIAEIGQHNTIEHCYVRGVVFGIVIAGSAPRFTTLRYDTIHAVGQNSIDVGSTGDGTTAYHGTLIEYCVLDTSFVEDNIQFEPDYGDPTSTLHNRGTIIRYNTMGNAAENAIDLKGAGHTLIENNLIYSSMGNDDGPLDGNDAGSGGGVTSNANTPTRNTIVRGNVIWDHVIGLDMAEGDHYYNNTILNNRRTWQGPNQTTGTHAGLMAYNYPNTQRAFLNNIVGGQNGQFIFDWLMDHGDKFHLDNNIYFDQGASVRFSHRRDGSKITTVGLEDWKNVLATYGGYAYLRGKDASSQEVDPQFVNAPPDPSGYDPAWNFRLGAGSPAIDAGVAVTSASTAGSNSTLLSVDDANFFSDGFGAVEGDLIMIGGGTSVRITTIDYARNLITLASPRTWASGAGIHLAYQGNAPDIGAFESGVSGTPAALGAVQLASPANGTTGLALSATLAWTALSAATSYQVQVSTGLVFSSTVADASGITSTSFAPTSLANNTLYYWRVRGVNQGGSGAWSGVRTFTTIAGVTSPSTILLAIPPDGANGISVTPTLSWNGVSTATSYQLQVSTGTAFLSTVADVSGIASTSFDLPSLATNSAYYWRVRGVNQVGNGPWSSVRSFTTITTVSAPSASLLATPADGTTGLPVTPTLTWNGATTATSYQLQISTGAAFASTVVNASNITTTTYTSPPLAANTPHYWRVRGVNAGGAGAWSVTRNFTTVAPTGGSDGAATQLVRNGSFESGPTDWVFTTGGTGSYTTVSPGYNSATSARVTITTISGTMRLTQQSVPLNQNTMYRLSFAGKSTGGRDMTIGVSKQTSPTTSYGLQSRVIQLTGSWRTFSVYFQSANVTETISDAMVQFGFEGYARAGDRYWLDSVDLRQTAPPPLPSAPSNILPAAGALDQPTNLAVNWTWVDDADGYRVQISQDASFTSAVVDTVVPDTVAIVGPLKDGTKYYRRIQTINISGPGPFSTPAMFTTSTNPEKKGPDESLPLQIGLAQNFPNPFNPATVIRYRLAGQTHVLLRVYNLLGEEVATLVDTQEKEGEHSVTFNASGLPSGAYFYRLHADGVVETRKMMLTR